MGEASVKSDPTNLPPTTGISQPLGVFFHENAFIWTVDPLTGRPTRLASMPYGATPTSLHLYRVISEHTSSSRVANYRNH